MGWTSSPEWTTKKEIADYLRDRDLAVGYTPMGSAIKGNIFWQNIKNPNGDILPTATLIRNEGREYGYKDVPPEEHIPPMHILNAVSMNKSLEDWRDSALSHYEEQRIRKNLSPGTVVEYDSKRYKLVTKIDSRNGWEVEEVKTGNIYRMKVKQLMASAIITSNDHRHVQPNSDDGVVLKFDVTSLQQFIESSLNATKRFPSLDQRRDPQFWLPTADVDPIVGFADDKQMDYSKVPHGVMIVKGRGVYAMSNAMASSEGELNNVVSKVSYAEGYGPDINIQDAFTGAGLGRDNFALFISVDDLVELFVKKDISIDDECHGTIDVTLKPGNVELSSTLSQKTVDFKPQP